MLEGYSRSSWKTLTSPTVITKLQGELKKEKSTDWIQINNEIKKKNRRYKVKQNVSHGDNEQSLGSI